MLQFLLFVRSQNTLNVNSHRSNAQYRDNGDMYKEELQLSVQLTLSIKLKVCNPADQEMP